MDKKPDNSNGLDPDLAELLSLEEEPPARPAPGQPARARARQPAGPRDEDLRGEAGKASPTSAPCSATSRRRAAAAEGIDATRKKFEPIRKFEEAAKPLFVDKNHYRAVLSGEGEAGQRVHELVTKFMKATDPEEKSGFRARLITAFWELATQHRGPGRPGASRCRSACCCATACSRRGSSPRSCATCSPGSCGRTTPASRSTTSTSGSRRSRRARCGRRRPTRSRRRSGTPRRR